MRYYAAKCKNAFFVVALAFAMVACAGLTPSQEAFVLCSGYSSSLSALAAHKRAGRLSAGVVSTVDATRAILNPLCKNARSAILDVQAIRDGVRTLLELKGAADG